MGGYKRWVLALARILPIALRVRAGAAPRGSRPRCSNLLDFAKFFQIGRSAFVIPSTRDALGWAGKFGKLCRIVWENNFEFWEIT